MVFNPSLPQGKYHIIGLQLAFFQDYFCDSGIKKRKKKIQKASQVAEGQLCSGEGKGGSHSKCCDGG